MPTHITTFGPDVFDHLRSDDGEHVGYIDVTDAGEFVPFDLLQQRRGEPMDLDEAEAVLDAIGLRMLAEDWELREEAAEGVPAGTFSWMRVRIREVTRSVVIVNPALDDGVVAKSVDLNQDIVLELPTERLRPAHAE